MEDHKRVKHEKKMDKLMKKIAKDEAKKGRKLDVAAGSHYVKEKLVEKKPDEQAVKKDVKKDKKVEKKARHEGKISTVRLFVYFMMAMLVLTAIYYIVTRNANNSFFVFSGAVVLFSVYLYMKKKLKRFYEIKKMEEVFPDFISLMSSNLRAGMTVDRALVLSARKEFAPLDKEIMQVGKDILTAREISEALYEMGQRIGSEEIKKTIQLIISGIRSGGSLSVLLEHTANNMRERNFVKKRAASNVLMYVIFIFFAVAIGAPLLFALSSTLVQIMSAIFADVPTTATNTNLPFTISSINVSLNFILYYSAFFITASAILASLILGLVSNGNEKDGLKYTIPLILIGLTVFFLARWLLGSYFSNLFA
ncbi:MAG: type II secretion system F family protein [archaeon]